MDSLEELADRRDYHQREAAYHQRNGIQIALWTIAVELFIMIIMLSDFG